MTLRSRHLVPIIFVIFIAGIGGTMIFNLWQTTSSKVPATYKSGDFAGQSNPADIRGSYSFADIEKAFAVPVADLARAFGVEKVDNPAAFLCKQLEDLYGEMENGEIGTGSVKWFVALYRGLPYTPEEDILLPSPSIAVLRERLSEADLEVVKARTVSLSGLKPVDTAAASETAEAATEQTGTAAGSEPAVHTEDKTGLVRGPTTFGELRSWGVTQEAIEQALGLPAGKAGVSLRDYCISNGIEFGVVKEKLQAAVDRALGKQ